MSCDQRERDLVKLQGVRGVLLVDDLLAVFHELRQGLPAIADHVGRHPHAGGDDAATDHLDAESARSGRPRRLA